MRDPAQLHVMEAAEEVAALAYRATDRLPPGERGGLYTQMRRAAISIGSNISEGCGRSTDAQFSSFLQIAMGSACELEFQARIAGRLSLAPTDDLMELHNAIITTKRMLAKLIVALRVRSRPPSPKGGAPRRRPESERSDAP